MKILSFRQAAPLYNIMEEGNKGGVGAFIKQEPSMEVLPEGALLRKGWPFFVPDWAEGFTAQLRWGVLITRLGKDIAPRFAPRYYEGLRLAIQFASSAGATCFDGSVALSSLTEEGSVRLNNGATCPPDSASELFPLMVAHASRYLTLRTGDLLLGPLFGSPLSVREGQPLTAYLDDRPLLHVRIK